MSFEIRLKKILDYNKLANHGICLQIANEAHIHRHTVSKIYNNTLNSISLDVLEKLCVWLEKKTGETWDTLPQALFEWRPPALLEAIAKPGRVTIYLGEYFKPEPLMRWISLRDSRVYTKFIENLNKPYNKNQSDMDKNNSSRMNIEYPPDIETRYVTYKYAPVTEEGKSIEFERDAKSAKKIFKQMRSSRHPRTTIMIGSQKVNHLVEVFVADLFDCEPFISPTTKVNVPFYLAYRKNDRCLPSCFGGFGPPPGYKGEDIPGIYYKEKRGKWAVCPWVNKERGGGIVITIYDPGTTELEMCIFGFSGLGTWIMGDQMFNDYFWSNDKHYNPGKQVSVYVAKFHYTIDETSQEAEEKYNIKKFEVNKINV